MHRLDDLLARLGRIGRPVDASAHGWRGDALFAWIAIVVALVLLAVLAHLALVILRSRRGGPPSASRGDDPRARLIVAVATLALIGLVDAVSLWRSAHDLPAWVLRAPGPGEIEVEVMAQQWAFGFRLAGADGRFGTEDDIVRLHALTLPAGRPARLELRSKDVIHSLFIPSLRVKRDAQPGATTELYLEPARPGTYQIVCAQLCGASHYLMQGTLEIVDPARWDAWVAAESALAVQRARATPDDGRWAWSFGR